MKTVDQKVAVVTGAASGIGKAMAECFLNAGMQVVMADVETAALEAAAAELGNTDNVLAVTADVSKPESVDALAAAAVERFGKVHVLCNNAGVFSAGASWEATDADYRWLLDVNVLGIANGLRSFVPGMIAHGEEAHIVITASMAGMTTMPFSSVYCMSKFAAVGLAECLYKELEQVAPQIGVSVLCPELINTGIGKAERNRPKAYSGSGDVTDTELAQMTTQALIDSTAGGLDPMVMAERVLKGIHDRKFYLLAEDFWKDIACVRLDEVRAETNPSFKFPEQA